MAKKNASKSSSVMGILKETFSTMIFAHIVSWFKEVMHNVQESIYNTTRKILESFLAMMVLVIGIAMVVVSLPFLLSYYIPLPASLFFVIIGFIMIIVSVVSFNHINKTK